MDKKLERRKRMIQAARKLFAEHGFEQTTMQKIASEANIGVATVFRYFPKKDHLIIEVIKEVIDQQMPNYERIRNSEKSVLEKVDDLLTSYILFISEENSDSTKLLEAFELYVAYTPVEAELLEEIYQSYEKISHVIKSIFNEKGQDGSVQLSQDVETQIRTILNMFGTAVKKYSLYSQLPGEVIGHIPRKQELTMVKDMVISWLKHANK